MRSDNPSAEDDASDASREERIRYEIRLVAACLAHDPNALKEFVNRYSPNVAAAITRVIQLKSVGKISQQQVDESCEEFWVRFLEQPHGFIGRFIPGRGELRSFIYSIAYRRCVRGFSRRRRRLRKRSRVLFIPLDLIEDLIERLWRSSFQALVARSQLASWLAKLNEEFRWIIEARWGIAPCDHRWSFCAG